MRQDAGPVGSDGMSWPSGFDAQGARRRDSDGDSDAAVRRACCKYELM